MPRLRHCLSWGLIVSLVVYPGVVPVAQAQSIWGTLQKIINPDFVASVASVTHSNAGVMLTESLATQAMYKYLDQCRPYFEAVADQAEKIGVEGLSLPEQVLKSTEVKKLSIAPKKAIIPKAPLTALDMFPQFKRPAPIAPLSLKQAAKLCKPHFDAYRAQEAILQNQIEGWWKSFDAQTIHTSGDYSGPIQVVIHEFERAVRKVFFQRGHTDMWEFKEAPQCSGDFLLDGLFSRYLLAVFRAPQSVGAASVENTEYVGALKELQRHLGCFSPQQSYQLDLALRVAAELVDVLLETRGYPQVRNKFRSALLNPMLLVADTNSPLGATFTYRWLRTYVMPTILSEQYSVLPNHRLALYNAHTGALEFFRTCDDSGVFAPGVAAELPQQPLWISQYFTPHVGTGAAGDRRPTSVKSGYPDTGYGISTNVAATENCQAGLPAWRKIANQRPNCDYPLTALQFVLDPVHQGYGVCNYLDMLKANGTCKLYLCGNREMELQGMLGGKGAMADYSAGTPQQEPPATKPCDFVSSGGVFSCLAQGTTAGRQGNGGGRAPRNERVNGNWSEGCGTGIGPIDEDGGGEDGSGESGGDNGGGDDKSNDDKNKEKDDNKEKEKEKEKEKNDNSGGGQNNAKGPSDNPKKADKYTTDNFSSQTIHGEHWGMKKLAADLAQNLVHNQNQHSAPQQSRIGGEHQPVLAEPGPRNSVPGGIGQSSSRGDELPPMFRREKVPPGSVLAGATDAELRLALGILNVRSADKPSESEAQLRQLLYEIATLAKEIEDPQTGKLNPKHPKVPQLRQKLTELAKHPRMVNRYQRGTAMARNVMRSALFKQFVFMAAVEIYPELADKAGLALDQELGKGKIKPDPSFMTSDVAKSADELQVNGSFSAGGVTLGKLAEVRIYLDNIMLHVLRELLHKAVSEGSEFSVTVFEEAVEQVVAGVAVHEVTAHAISVAVVVNRTADQDHRLIELVEKMILNDYSEDAVKPAAFGKTLYDYIGPYLPPIVGGGSQGGGIKSEITETPVGPQFCDPSASTCGACNLLTQQAFLFSMCFGLDGGAAALVDDGVDKTQLPGFGLTPGESNAAFECLGLGGAGGGAQACPMQMCGPGEVGVYLSGGGGSCSCKPGGTDNPSAIKGSPAPGSIGCQVMDCPPAETFNPASCSCQPIGGSALPVQ